MKIFFLESSISFNSNDLNSETIIYSGIVSVLGIAAILANYYLLSKYDVAFIAPIVEGLLLACNVIFSVIFLGETVTWNTVLGVAMIVAGVGVCYMK